MMSESLTPEDLALYLEAAHQVALIIRSLPAGPTRDELADEVSTAFDNTLNYGWRVDHSDEPWPFDWRSFTRECGCRVSESPVVMVT
jgi:hypothetical protein